MALRLEAATRSGDQALVLSRVTLSIGDRLLLEPFSATVNRGEVIGLVGPNGSGKSTLLGAIAGERPLDGGEFRVPDSVRLAYHRQDLTQVPVDRTIYDVIADLRPSWPRGAVQGHLGRFGFSGDEVLRRAGTLSGGERARLGLAILMLAGADLVLLDEPTNHLDIESIEAIEDALEEYDGTAILVSHDRALLRSLTTRLWLFEGTRIVDFPGGFEEWEAVAAERKSAAAAAAKAAAKVERREKGRDVRQAQQTRPPHEERRADASARRTAQRAAVRAEEEVGQAEARVRELERALEVPELYAEPDGARRAAALVAELQAAKRALEEAYERWSAAESLKDA
jgi:ATP-binding cassette, subfamily F, member 3